MHVHVWSPDGEAKIWIEPEIELAMQKGMTGREILELIDVTKERIDEIKDSWQKHFSD